MWRSTLTRFGAALTLIMLLCSGTALADYGAILSKNVKVYSDSSMKQSVGTLPKYASVRVKSSKSGKAKLSLNGIDVWINNKYLTNPWKTLLRKRWKRGIEHTEDLLRYVKRSCYIYMYPSTKSSHSHWKLKRGDVYSVCAEKNGWSLLLDESDTFFGYVRTSNLEGISGGDGVHYALK